MASDIEALKKLALAVDVVASAVVMIVASSSSSEDEKIFSERSESGEVAAEQNRCRTRGEVAASAVDILVFTAVFVIVKKKGFRLNYFIF